jgi:multiple sugar transport system permease protein
LVAYGFSRIQWPGRNALFYLCVATIFLPYPVILVALFDIFGRLPSIGIQGAKSWVDTFLPLIVPAFFGNPFYIFLMRQFMLGIPKELSDAAKVDGASELQTFWRVILPLTRPAVIVVLILAAVAAWNEFLLPLLYLQSNDKYPLAVGLIFFTSEHDVSYNLLMAASTLIVLPVVIIFLVAQRFFIEGITVGGVKG